MGEGDLKGMVLAFLAGSKCPLSAQLDDVRFVILTVRQFENGGTGSTFVTLWRDRQVED